MKKLYLSKKLYLAYLISFVISLMLYIYEPLLMYSGNVSDFWFDAQIMIKPIFIAFLLLFLILSLIFTVIFIIDKKYLSKYKIYDISLIVYFVILICLYIQGNFLNIGYGDLNGSDIEWKNAIFKGILNTLIWIAIFAFFNSTKFEKPS